MMTCESKFAEELGYAEEGLVEDTLSLLTLYELPVNPDQLDPRPDPYAGLRHHRGKAGMHHWLG